MRFKREVIILVGTLMAVLLVFFGVHVFPGFVPLYCNFIFYPFQWLRGLLFGFLPFSLGDLLYYAAAIWALVTVVKWLKFIISFRRNKHRLVVSLLKTGTTSLCIYLLFFLGWGANYSRIPLGKSWGLDSIEVLQSSDGQGQMARNELIAFDTFLVNKLNCYAPHFHAMKMSELNTRACRYYNSYTNCRLGRLGLGIKSTLMGWLLRGIELEGYYNPFTGEGQFDKKQPPCSMPELFTHEIAHQAGIAAEGDANLLSYAVCTASGDSSFCYSAYLNAWQLTNERLSDEDSELAVKFEQQLNPLTVAHLDSLEQLSKKYNNQLARIFNKFFDQFLKTQSKDDGLDDYATISTTAWRLEQKRANGMRGIIRVR